MRDPSLLNGQEYNGFFRPILKVYKIGSRRTKALQNVSSMGPQITKQKSHDDSDEFIRVRKVPGYSIVVTYTESNKIECNKSSEVLPPPEKRNKTQSGVEPISSEITVNQVSITLHEK